MPMPKSPPWSQQELAILADIYPREGINGAADALPDRSWKAIFQRASKMGLRSPVASPAPRAKLQGADLAQAVRLREDKGWAFARIGACFGVSESAACNAVIAAQSVKAGYRPARRDANGRLVPEELERLRLMLKKGLKGVEIQLRMGLSASRVAEERRRYDRDLKERGKALLPPPGGGEAYCGVKVPKAVKAEIERLLLEGYGAQAIAKQCAASKSTVGRIRTRLVARLRKRGEALPGCDVDGKRRRAKASLRFIPQESIDALRARLLDREPVRRAANALGIGISSAYRIRDELAAEMAARGEALPAPILPGRVRPGTHDGWLPPELLSRHRLLVREIGLEAATAQVKREMAEAKAAERAARITAAKPATLEQQIEALRRGARLVPAFKPHAVPTDRTLGGVSSGMIA